jgi:orotate phosphoribosyltransferase
MKTVAKGLQGNEVIKQFQQTGALLDGHFVLSSGLHSTTYLQCAIALQSPAIAARFGSAIAEQFMNDGIETVASPAIGGLIIGYEVARHLGTRFIWTEREAGRMTLRRGFSVRASDRILVVEDVITTGGSTRETIEALRRNRANVVAAASIIDRSGGKADVGVSLFSLATLELAAAAPEDCEACKRGDPAMKPGSRRSAV